MPSWQCAKTTVAMLGVRREACLLFCPLSIVHHPLVLLITSPQFPLPGYVPSLQVIEILCGPTVLPINRLLAHLVQTQAHDPSLANYSSFSGCENMCTLLENRLSFPLNVQQQEYPKGKIEQPQR